MADNTYIQQPARIPDGKGGWVDNPAANQQGPQSSTVQPPPNSVDAQGNRVVYNPAVGGGWNKQTLDKTGMVISSSPWNPQDAIDGTNAKMAAAYQAAQKQKEDEAAKQAIETTQAANQATTDNILGRVADPFSSQAVQTVNQAEQNTANQLASKSSTNAYQSGDIAQQGMQSAQAGANAFGQGETDRNIAAAGERQNALADLGTHLTSSIDTSMKAAGYGLDKTATDINSSFQQIVGDESNLDATAKQKIAGYQQQVTNAMAQYSQALKDGETDHNKLLGFLQLGLGALAAAASVVAAPVTGGVSLAGLGAAAGIAANGAGKI